jgi:hypothetical protein
VSTCVRDIFEVYWGVIEQESSADLAGHQFFTALEVLNVLGTQDNLARGAASSHSFRNHNTIPFLADTVVT